MTSKNELLSQAACGLLALTALLAVLFFLPSSSPTTKGSPKEASAVLEECNKSALGKKETCYSKALEKLSYESGPEHAFVVLTDVQKKDRDTIGCHFIAHGIGYGAYRRTPEDWQKNFQSISQACSYGAMHGILEMRLLDEPESLRKERIRDICGNSPRGDCNHIVGHLSLLLSENHIDRALTTCKGLTVGLQQFFCFSGVFMENITALNLIKHGFADESYLDWAARVDDIEQTCLSYKDEEARACWEEIVHALVVKFKNNAREVYAFCDRAPQRDFAIGCKRHATGILAAGLQFDLSKAGSLCTASDDPEFRAACSGNVVASVLATIPGSGKEAIRFCSAIKDASIGNCFEMIGNSLPQSERQSVCALAPSAQREACLKGDSNTGIIRNDQDF